MFSIRPFQPVDAHTWKGYTQKLAFYVMFLLPAVRGVICMRHANKYTIYYLNVYNAHLFLIAPFKWKHMMRIKLYRLLI